jgi:hypothetical protein
MRDNLSLIPNLVNGFFYISRKCYAVFKIRLWLVTKFSANGYAYNIPPMGVIKIPLRRGSGF